MFWKIWRNYSKFKIKNFVLLWFFFKFDFSPFSLWILEEYEEVNTMEIYAVSSPERKKMPIQTKKATLIVIEWCHSLLTSHCQCSNHIQELSRLYSVIKLTWEWCRSPLTSPNHRSPLTSPNYRSPLTSPNHRRYHHDHNIFGIRIQTPSTQYSVNSRTLLSWWHHQGIS